MASYTLDFSKYDADPRVIAWCEANNIDPYNTPAEQLIVVEDNTINYEEWLLEPGEPGHRPHRLLNADKNGYVRVARQTPLLSSPADHNL